jgi:hypothetical protein
MDLLWTTLAEFPGWFLFRNICAENIAIFYFRPVVDCRHYRMAWQKANNGIGVQRILSFRLSAVFLLEPVGWRWEVDFELVAMFAGRW